MPERIRVASGAPYDVVVGSGDVTDEVVSLVRPDAARVLLVGARPVADLVARLTAALEARGLTCVSVELPDGEAAKTVAVATDLWSRLGQAGFTRTDVVIGVGGGAVTDLAGFVASTWLRGVDVIHVPTTLLAMVDAAVGGKSAINIPEGKNLVGTFHEPAGVLVDLSCLATLPRRDLVAGLAEVVKGGFIADPRILELVEADPSGATDPASPVLAELVTRKIRVKAQVVSADLRESSLREILNYGHTFAHAVEQTSGYTVRHGEAVAVGLLYAAHLAHLAGRLDSETLERHRRVLDLVGLPTSYAQVTTPAPWEDLLTAMRRDKKTRAATLRFVVLDEVGRPGRLEAPDPQWLVEAFQAVRG